jgi:cell division protein FtsB
VAGRMVLGVLVIALLALQYRLWVSPNGVRDLWRTESAIESQRAENEKLQERNRRLAAEVRDLKEGRAAIEERARTDLGMIGRDETFFQVVPPAAPGPAQVPAPAPAQEQPQRTAEAAPK